MTWRTVLLALKGPEATDASGDGHMIELQQMKTVCLWSGPRNVSTALMYSFAQRADSQVVDEPLYGHYLRVSGAEHPGRDEVMTAMNCEGDTVMRNILESPPQDATVKFIKQMAHHLVELDLWFLPRVSNIFLVRDPKEMLPSLTVQLPDAGLVDTGLETQWRLFEQLAGSGQIPAVIDSRELLLDPPGVLRQLCEHLEIAYIDKMLSWDAGAIAEDGVWAPYWYHAVHESTGFSPYVEKTGFPEHLEPLLEICAPWYDRLYDHAIRATKGE